MRPFLPAIPLLLAILTAPAAAQDAPVLAVRFEPMANLTYQLDCVAGLPMPCSEANFRALWEREMLQGDADRALLAEWKRVRARYDRSLALPSPAPFPLGGRVEALSVFEKGRIAGFAAASVDDYATRMELLATPGDRARLAAVLRHFAPRFDAWWRRDALPDGTPFARATEELLRGREMAAHLARLARFYGAAPEDTLQLVLLYRPKLVPEGTEGQQVENRSLVEFVAGERPEARLDVAVHEIAHYLMSRMADPALRALEERFVALAPERPAAVAAYNLLDEALATALGNGATSRALLPRAQFDALVARPLSLYNDSSIDRAGKATLAWIERWMAEGRALDDPAFPTRYVEALEAAFGPSLAAPRLQLARLVLLSDATYGLTFRDVIRGALRPSSFMATEDACCTPEMLAPFRESPAVGALLIVHPSRLDALAAAGAIAGADAAAIRARVEKEGEALYAFRRSPAAFAYVVSAEDAMGVARMIRRLAAARAPFTGFAAPGEDER